MRLCLMLCFLVIFNSVSSIEAQQQPTQQQPDKSADKQAESSGDNLPWQPGLGNGQVPPRDNTPPPAQPLPQTMPQGQPTPQIVLPVPQQGTGMPINQQPTPAHNPMSQVEHSVVVPAAFFQQDNQNLQQNNVPSQPVTPANVTRVTRDMDTLPNDAGQVWRTYDISPYTLSVTSTNRPEQALIEWILKETGTDLWFSEPLGVMNATRDKLHVYHTPEIHARLKSIIDRFVYSRGQASQMGLKLLTVTNPNWRTTAFSMLQPVEVQSPGVEAWLMSKENAALLASQLRNRSDYQEHHNGDLNVIAGQKYALTRTRPVSFVRNLQWVNDGIGRYQPLMDRIDEGFTMEFSALGSLDGTWQETIIRCNIDQIEKMQRVSVDLPTSGGQYQTVDLHVPQMVVWRLHERFRWPTDKVLVLSCGVVAAPAPQPNGLLGLSQLLSGGRDRADAIMFIEHKGAGAAAPATNGQLGGMVPINRR